MTDRERINKAYNLLNTIIGSNYIVRKGNISVLISQTHIIALSKAIDILDIGDNRELDYTAENNT